MAQKTIVGNWKMQGSGALVASLVPQVASFAASQGATSQIVICPPFTLLGAVEKAVQGSFLSLGAQDCSAHKDGAFTGDISASMLKDAGCGYVIVGHSERRQYHAETDAVVKTKALAAIEAGLIPIICVGETQDERAAGRAKHVVEGQVAGSIPHAPSHFLLAYEPVWAIGSGQVPSTQDIADMHAHLASMIPNTAILYGGSVKAANAAEILAVENVSGVLVGGASLKADEFCGIIAAAED